MKRATRIVLVIVFFAFVAAGLVTHVCLTCYPDHEYLVEMEQAFLAEGGQGQEASPVLTAWDRARANP